ncbi:protein Dok-7-like isoform X1 [Anguilla rostrata]|uniref:protein Dok-7-like isoform X1 n=1 Tax=Anguilla rostrata TaxID=7938 RepID=UPI0030D380A0
MTDTVVVEGQVKYRDGKKWKSRWVALRKPSPVADCLQLLAYKDRADKTKGHRERSSVTLEDICGLEPIASYEGMPYTLAILCLSQPVMLGFESRDALLAWDARVRYSLGEVHRFSVGVQPGTKLESGPAALHLCNNLLGLARDLPPAIVGQWKLSDLRRYGAVPNGFVFEGGTRCGYWAGVFFLSCAEGEQISFLFDCIVRGISPTRGPFGLRPALPDPSADPAHAEERLNLEAQELEKRLSLLSHCSRQSSTAASTCSYGTSVAGDDRSISSSSSEASQSDTSIGSRLTMWAEPVMSPAPAESLGPPAAKGALHGEEKLCGAVVGGARPQGKPPRSRQLQEIGRQGSSDSGIATGSHSSYTGSFSSYAGSIDTCQGEEFGSLLSLPPSHAPDHAPCTCPLAEGPGSEYLAPAALRHLYDTPRTLLLGPAPKDQASLPSPRPPGAEVTGGGDGGGASTDPIPKSPDPQGPGPAPDSRTGSVAPSADPCGISRSLFAPCPICGGFKGTVPTHAGVLGMPAIPGGEEEEQQCRCGPGSGAEDLRNAEDIVHGDPSAAANRLHGNGPREMSRRTNGREPLQRNLLQGQQNPLGLFLGFYGQPRTTGSHGRKRGGWSVYETMTTAFRCGLRAGPPSSRRSWGTPAGLEDRGVSPQGNESRGGANWRALSETKTVALPTAVLRDVPNSVSPPPGNGPLPHRGDGSTPPKTGTERCGSPPDPGRVCQEVSGRSATEDDRKPKRKEDGGKSGVAYEIMEGFGGEKTPETEERGRSLELTGSRGQQRVPYEAEGATPAGCTGTSKVHRQTSATDPKGSYEPMAFTADPPRRFEPCAGEYGGVFTFPPEASPAGGAADRTRGDGVIYVNIPISPTSKKQLHYMELELQEPGSGVRGNTVQLRRHRGGSTKYAQIDIAATETAHRVGTQHAQGREDRLQELEQKRKGAQQ